MHLGRLALWALPLVGGSHALTRPVEGDEAPVPVPRGYILEYDRSDLRKRQVDIESIPNIQVLRTFDSNVFSGVSVETEDFNIDSLATLPDVVRVWLNERVYLAPYDVQTFSDDAAAFNYTTHNATGVSKLHDKGIFGEGVKVGVVDTGIYYDHAALGGGFGPGFKVEGGWDFVGDGDWPAGPRDPDDDPNDTRGHGTHVAGIIAAKTDFWQGVAPEATLYAYKVFTEAPSTSTDILIESFLHAYEDGCDIITASIGGANGWSENAWAEVASRLVEEGVVVTISAGNNGAAGPFYGSSGSSGKNVVAVASVATEFFPASPFDVTFALDGETNITKIGYLPATDYFPPNVSDWPVVPLNLDVTIADDACEPFPDNSTDLTGTVPLVRRGSCTFAVKQENLEALGAEYILIYNDDNPIIAPSTERESSLIGMITSEAGQSIINTIVEGGNVTADFSTNPEEVVAIDYPAGGRPSPFTSWPALWDLQVKPDIAAPGGNIFSTYPLGEYAVISGTSMACPYVAGVAALWMSAHGGRDVNGKGFAKELAQRLISSGTSLPWSDGTATDYGYPAPVAQVGNGLINAWKVLEYDTRLEFDKIALNDTRYFSRYHDVTIINEGDASVEYTWSSEHGAGVEALGWFPADNGASTKRLRSFTELSPTDFEAEISFPRSFTLGPGESKTVSVNFNNPDRQGWNASALPLYGGKVIISGSNGEQLSVPYFGVGGDLRRELSPLSQTGYPHSVSGVDNTPITEDSSYSFDLSVEAQDFPKIYNKILWGSRQIRWDIYESGWRERSWEYPPVVGENGYVGSVAAWSSANAFDVFDPDVHDPDSTFNFPVTNTARNAETTNEETRYYWFGKLANGTQIAEGKYATRFAALKPFGDPNAADNWEVYRTPEIEVTGQY